MQLLSSNEYHGMTRRGTVYSRTQPYAWMAFPSETEFFSYLNTELQVKPTIKKVEDIIQLFDVLISNLSILEKHIAISYAFLIKVSGLVRKIPSLGAHSSILRSHLFQADGGKVWANILEYERIQAQALWETYGGVAPIPSRLFPNLYAYMSQPADNQVQLCWRGHD